MRTAFIRGSLSQPPLPPPTGVWPHFTIIYDTCTVLLKKFMSTAIDDFSEKKLQVISIFSRPNCKSSDKTAPRPHCHRQSISLYAVYIYPSECKYTRWPKKVSDFSRIFIKSYWKSVDEARFFRQIWVWRNLQRSSRTLSAGIKYYTRDWQVT